jgi:hypothetical protein
VTIEEYTWSYKVLQKFYKGVCTYYYADGEIVEEGYEISLE